MKLSGFTFVRNGILFDYPFLESIHSILPICDEFVIAVGESTDGTLTAVKHLQNPKIKIIETKWDDSLREGGRVLADQTNIALDNVSGDWAFYLQADEVVHERDLPAIHRALETHHNNFDVEGLLFSFKHFYGAYSYVGTSRRWYRREIRILRTGIGARSWGDAQGFRIRGRKIRVKLVDASIYHYGWVKAPTTQQKKQKTFNRYWHTDDWMRQNIKEGEHYDYTGGGPLVEFRGTHPSVMAKRVKNQDWHFHYDPHVSRRPVGERVLDWFESVTGVRPGEYRNYVML